MYIDKIVIVGGTGSINQVDFISENNIPVIVTQPYRLPQSTDADPRETFATCEENVIDSWNIS